MHIVEPLAYINLVLNFSFSSIVEPWYRKSTIFPSQIFLMTSLAHVTMHVFQILHSRSKFVFFGQLI